MTFYLKSQVDEFSLHFVVTTFALQIVCFVNFVLCGIRVLVLHVC